jgi:hypothetical protein
MENDCIFTLYNVALTIANVYVNVCDPLGSYDAPLPVKVPV